MVAARSGRSVAAVLEEPYALTLWAFVQMQDAERIAGEIRRRERLEMAHFDAYAFHAPKELGRIEREVLGEIPTASAIAEKEARAIAKLRALHRPRTPDGDT